MFCKWCGKEIKSDLNFCPFCGRPVKKGEVPRTNIDKSTGETSQSKQKPPNIPIIKENNSKSKKSKKTKILAIILGIVCLILVAVIVLISLGIIDLSMGSLFNKGSLSDKPIESSPTNGDDNAEAATDNILYWPGDDLPNGVPEIEGVVITSIQNVGEKGALTITFEKCNSQEAKNYADKLDTSGWTIYVNKYAEGTRQVMMENDQNEMITFTWSETTNSGTIMYGFATHFNESSVEENEEEEIVDESSPDFIIDIEDTTFEAAISSALERLGENVNDGITIEEMSKLKYLAIYNTENDYGDSNFMENLGWFLVLTGIELDDCYFTEDPIENIEALKYAVNLEGLLIAGYDIFDITPLSSLIKLEILVLPHNKISDLSPLSSLENVWLLNLVGNNISDISPLAGTNIEDLEITENNITDFSPLNECKELRILHVDGDGENDIDMIDN